MDVIGFSEAATANSRIEIINANPDSTSGIVTVPKTIASGETITIPAGRTAILPGLVVEGDLLVEGTVFIPTGSTYTQETIKTEAISNVAGSTVVNVTDIAKSSIVTPALALKANTADLKEIGVGQTWQDVTANRIIGATYSNTTEKPIMVNISIDTYVSYQNIIVNGVSISNGANMGGGNPVFIVPNNSTYSLAGTNIGIIQAWSELR